MNPSRSSLSLRGLSSDDMEGWSTVASDSYLRSASFQPDDGQMQDHPGPYVSGSIAALWHDPRYSFANRFARSSAKAAAESAKGKGYLKPESVAPQPVQAPATYLQSMVVDGAVHDVEHEL